MSLITRKALAAIDQRRGSHDFNTLVPAYEAALNLLEELYPEAIVELETAEVEAEIRTLEILTSRRSHMQHDAAAERLAALRSEESEEEVEL